MELNKENQKVTVDLEHFLKNLEQDQFSIFKKSQQPNC